MQITDDFRVCIFCRIKNEFSVLVLTNMAKSISYNNNRGSLGRKFMVIKMGGTRGEKTTD